MSSPPGRTVTKTPSPPSVEVANAARDGLQQPPMLAGPKYCDTCDITFNYTKTFIAHKNFYCKALTSGATGVGAGPGGMIAGGGGGVATVSGAAIRRSASASPGRAATAGGATSPVVTVAVNRATETSV